jgi:putative DNA primase/helicase
MAASPNGHLWARDELAGLFCNLEKKGRETDRAFLLECWNGQGAFSMDRIGRGNIHVDHTITSIFGTIQPEPLAQYLAGGVADDGFMQRFQLALWPEVSKKWHDVDRVPDEEAREAVFDLFQKLADIGLSFQGAGESDGVPYVQFAADAQELLKEYRSKLEHHLRNGADTPTMETHLSKFRGLVPRLALVFHLCESGEGQVKRDALEKALRFAQCLESHARRIYTFAEVGDLFAAHRLADRIRDGELPAEFSAREVYRHNWSGLGKQDVELALDVLVDANWLALKREKTAGRPQHIYVQSPKLGEMKKDSSRSDRDPSGIWPV